MKLGTRAQWLWGLVLGGTLTLAAFAAVRAKNAQSGGADQNQTSSTPARKRSGGWHHFGHHDKTSRTRPAATGGWHYFGHPGAAPAPRPAPVRPAPHHPVPARRAPRAASPPPRRQYRPVTTREMEREMFRLINRDRRNSGGGRARPLRWDAKLAAEARAHSLDMVRGGYFGHVAPDGQTVIDRLDAAKIVWTAEGENIAIDPSVTGAERAFMNEPRNQRNHRWNILNPRYTDVGVGIVRGPGGEYYITQDFIQGTTTR